MQALAGTDITVNVSRAVTRLKSLFINFDKEADSANAVTKLSEVTDKMAGNFRLIKKPWNGFSIQ